VDEFTLYLKDTKKVLHQVSNHLLILQLNQSIIMLETIHQRTQILQMVKHQINKKMQIQMQQQLIKIQL